MSGLATYAPLRRRIGRMGAIEASHRLGERQMFDLLYEGNRIAAHLASEAHKPAGARKDGEVWTSMIVVEWAPAE
jgi:hypothetical protein